MDHHLVITRLVAEMLHKQRPVVGKRSCGGNLPPDQVLRGFGRLVVEAETTQRVKESIVVVSFTEPAEYLAVGSTRHSPAALNIALPEGAPEAARGCLGDDNGVLCDLPDPPGKAAQQELIAHPGFKDEFLVQLAYKDAGFRPAGVEAPVGDCTAAGNSQHTAV